MSSIKITIATEPRTLPPSTTFGGYRFTLKRVSSGNEVSTDPVVETTYIFPDATPGEYEATVVAVDSAGVQMGEGVTLAVTVPEGPARYEHPSGISIEVL